MSNAPGHNENLDILATRIFERFFDTVKKIGFLQETEKMTLAHILREIIQKTLSECKEEERIEQEADDIARRYGSRARILPGIKRVGVMGDERVYGACIEIYDFKILDTDYKTLELVSTEITNKVNGVVGVSIAIGINHS